MSVRYDILAVVGTYKKDGKDKPKYLKCGVVLDTKKGGLAMKLDAVPVASDGWFHLFEPKAKDGAQPKASGREIEDATFDESSGVPF